MLLDFSLRLTTVLSDGSIPAHKALLKASCSTLESILKDLLITNDVDASNMTVIGRLANIGRGATKKVLIRKVLKVLNVKNRS